MCVCVCWNPPLVGGSSVTGPPRASEVLRCPQRSSQGLGGPALLLLLLLLLPGRGLLPPEAVAALLQLVDLPRLDSLLFQDLCVIQDLQAWKLTDDVLSGETPANSSNTSSHMISDVIGGGLIQVVSDGSSRRFSTSHDHSLFF